MAYFRSRLQIFGLLSLNNKYNPRSKQHSWHYAKSICSRKYINDSNKRSISTLSKRRSERCVLTELKKKTRFSLSFQKASSTKRKKLAERKLTLWEYVFGPKRSSKNSCQPANRQEQTQCKEDDSRLHQATPADMLVYTNPIKSSRRLVEPQPKPPPSYKLPRAVLLRTSRAMKSDCKTVILIAPKKPYEEMRPASNTKEISEHQKKNVIRTEDIKPHEKLTSRQVSVPINVTEARIATAKILRQAMSREEPRIRSRIEQLKMLVNEKMIKSQHRE